MATATTLRASTTVLSPLGAKTLIASPFARPVTAVTLRMVTLPSARMPLRSPGPLTATSRTTAGPPMPTTSRPSAAAPEDRMTTSSTVPVPEKESGVLGDWPVMWRCRIPPPPCTASNAEGSTISGAGRPASPWRKIPVPMPFAWST